MLMSMIFFSFMLSILFTNLINPLSMGLVLLIQTIIISAISGSLSYSYWFSYILFMIFVGGMLVLFIYISSLASNENFKPSLSASYLIMITLLLSILFFNLDSLMISYFSLMPSSSIVTPTSTNKLSLWIYSAPIMHLTLFVILYLLLTLIVVVKIANMFKTPLRLIN